MRLAIASCRTLPAWERDDLPLYAALAARGLAPEVIPWDDPAVDWSVFDACLIRTTWDYWDDGAGGDRRGEFVAWAEHVAAVSRLFNPPEIIRWNTDKGYLRDLEAAGVPLAPTLWLARGESVDLAAVLHERGWGAGFVKPQIGACARGTLRFFADPADPSALAGPAGLLRAQAQVNAALARESLLLQPYLRRVEVEGETSLIFFDGRFSHAVAKIPVPGDYRVQDDHGASDQPATAEPAVIEAATAWVAAAGGAHAPLLYARVDLMRDDRGGWVLVELEAVEPSLFFRHDPGAADRLAAALCARLEALGRAR